MGDRGIGALQQRVHGVVDVCGARKASFAVLSQESGPVESLTVRNRLSVFDLTLSTRATLPSYILRGYKGRRVSYAHGDIPIEVEDVELPELLPGKAAEVEFSFSRLDVPHRVRFEVMRPTRVRAYSLEWQP